MALAVVYQLSYLRSQRWLSATFTKSFALLSVVGFFVRLTLLGVLLWAIATYTSLNLVAVVVAFIVVFTALSGYSLYRFAKGRPPTSPQVLL